MRAFFLGTLRSYERYIPLISRLLFGHVELALRGIGNDITDRRSFDEGGEEGLPVWDVKEGEAGAHLLPQIALGVLGAQRLLKEEAAMRLNLVDGKSQHHQQGEVSGQMGHGHARSYTRKGSLDS